MIYGIYYKGTLFKHDENQHVIPEYDFVNMKKTITLYNDGIIHRIPNANDCIVVDDRNKLDYAEFLI